MAENEARYAKPSSQLDLERRLENENRSSRILSTAPSYKEAVEEGGAREFAVEDNNLDNYLGVDVVYQNYASDTDEPLEAEGGPEKELLDQFKENLEAKAERPDPKEFEKDDEQTPVGETGDTGTSTATAISPAVPDSPDADREPQGRSQGVSKKPGNKSGDDK